MSSQRSSESGRCLDCGSSDFIETGYGPDACYDCGRVLEYEEDADSTPSLFVCPHCSHKGSIIEQLGREWCPSCGLDPSDVPPSSALAPLWGKGSSIQKHMYADSRVFESETRMGQFLRTSCGPHCSLSEVCPQSLGDLVECVRENQTTPLDSDKMGKKSKKAKRQRRQQNKADNAREYATIMCAKSGWFETIIHANTSNTEQSGDSGS